MLDLFAHGRVLFFSTLIIAISSTATTVSSDCPLLHSFINDTGILLVNRTTTMHTESTIFCRWFIVGSTYQRIVVQFAFLFIPVPVEEYLIAGCRRGSLSLWTPGFEHEKAEICGDRRNIRIGGVGQTLIIELRINDLKLDAQFSMHYQLVQIEQAISTPANLLASSGLPGDPFAECGLTSTNGYRFSRGVSSRIVGGHQAVPHSHPWQVLLSDRGKFCGATILNAHWIVTAAHCVNGTDPKHLLAEFGVHDRYSTESSRVTRMIRQIVVYPSYSGKTTRWIHDIALLQLSESLTFNPFVRAICLSAVLEFVRLGDRTLVTGWGETQGSGNFRYLREVEVPVQSNDQCGLKDISWTTSLCAGLCLNSTCDACQGDSGGPMVLLRNGRWHLVGLISWGFSCAGLGVYTKVSYYTDWISKIIYH